MGRQAGAMIGRRSMGMVQARWMIGIWEVLDGDGSMESCEGGREGGLLDAS